GLGRPGMPAPAIKPPAVKLPKESPEPPQAKRWWVAIDFVGAHHPALAEGADPLPTIVSYFKGPKDQWHVALPTYQTVLYRDLWPSIDLQYTLTTGPMKYFYTVQPGGDPRQIKLRYRGAASGKLDGGAVLVETPLGGIHDQRPVAWQDVDGCREDVQV